MVRRFKSPVELVSDIGCKAYDLQHHDERDIAEAVALVRQVNAPMFDWLVQVLSVTAGGSQQPSCSAVDPVGTSGQKGSTRD